MHVPRVLAGSAVGVAMLHHMDAGMAVPVQYEGFAPIDKAASTPASGAAPAHGTGH